MRFSFLALFLFILLQVQAQHKVGFQFVFDTYKIEPNKQIPFLDDTITFSKITLYVSAPKSNYYQLINAENPNRLNLDFEEFGANDLYLGVDSLTNVNGAMGGELDPTKGMYWTWQSGYINVKIEGKYSGCKTRKNKFQYHLGGYQSPFQTIQKIEIENQNIKTLILDIAPMVKQAIDSNWCEIMSPGIEAVQLSNTLKSGFKTE